MTPLGLTYVLRSGQLQRPGRANPPFLGPIPGTPSSAARDVLVYGDYMPSTDTTGVLPGTTLTDYNSPSVNNVTMSSGGVIESKRIYGDIKMSATSDLILRNCELVGGAHVPTSASGVVDCNNARTGRLTLIDCTIIPRRPSLNRDCIVGHRWRAYRCRLEQGVDGMGAFITTAKYSPQDFRADVIAMGNLVRNLAYGYPDYTNGVSGTATHTDGTHNDGFQHQGGTDVEVVGNFFDLTSTTMAGSGSNPAKPWIEGQGMANGTGILTQNNTGAGVDGTVRFLKNWTRGGLYHFQAINAGSPVLQGHRFFRAAAVSPAGATGSHGGYWLTINNRAANNVVGVQSGDTTTNRWVDGPYAGQVVAEPRDSGIHYYA